MNTENLIDRFGDAGPTLELDGAPFNNNADIFQMDIRPLERRAAHEALRAPQVHDSRSAIDRSLRQGEWFFLVPGEAEVQHLLSALAGHRSWVRRKVSIGSVIPRAGKPHVADELVVHLAEAGD